MAVRLAKTTRQTVTTIAHALAVAGLSKSVKGMEEFEAFWLEHQTPHTRAVVDLMLSEIQRSHRALAKEMKEQGYGTPT